MGKPPYFCKACNRHPKSVRVSEGATMAHREWNGEEYELECYSSEDEDDTYYCDECHSQEPLEEK